MEAFKGPAVDNEPNVKLEIEMEAEQFPHKLYVNIKSNGKALFVRATDHLVTVKYLNTKNEVDYSRRYFDRNFNPVTQ